MKVLLVSSGSGSRGGGEIFLLYLAEGLRNAGHEPLLWCPEHERMDELAGKFSAFGEVRREAYRNSYLDRRLRVVSALADRSTIARLADSFRGFDGDLIHLNKQTVEDGLDLGEALDRSGKPWVSTVHITQGNRELGAKLGGMRDGLGEWAFRKQGREAPIAVSDSRRRALTDRLGREVVRVYNGVPENPGGDRERSRRALCDRWGWEEGVFLVVCVARLEPQKDPSRFLKMAGQLVHVCPEARFIWVGDGGLRSVFEKEVELRGLTGKVVCSGWSDQAGEFLLAADLYLHPALYEGLPLAILEAMSAGLPCVLSKAIADEAEVFNESNLIVCRDDDDPSWTEKVLDRMALSEVGREGRGVFESNFRIDAMVRGYVERYVMALGKEEA